MVLVAVLTLSVAVIVYVNDLSAESARLPAVTAAKAESLDLGVNVHTEESIVMSTRYCAESDAVPPYMIGVSESVAGLLIIRGVCESVILKVALTSLSNVGVEAESATPNHELPSEI